MRITDLARRWSPFDGLGRLPAPAFDIGLAVIFVAALAVERSREPLDGGATMLSAWALASVLAGALVLRRRLPLTACLAGTCALCAESLLNVASAVSPYADQIGVYSLGLYATRSRARWGPAITLVGVLVYFVGTPATSPFVPVGVLFVWLTTWAIGYATARRREEQDNARRATRQQVLADERTRMARELHDLVGHTVNLLVVQAGAARLMLDKDPDMTRDLLSGMERIGREALTELDQVLGTLRAYPPESASAGRLDDAELRPSPGLAQLPELVSRLTGSGVEVTLSIDPELRLPRNLDLSAYRIVQEALTNTLKHAAPCSATVAVHQHGHTVVVEVCDDGPGAEDRAVPGRGLLGIAERVSTYGGAVEHGGGERGGFNVRAVLPLP